jgi:DNA-binding transcriptional ArsR family regulator
VSLLTTNQAAEELGVRPVTVRKHAPTLNGAQHNKDGHWLLPQAAIDELRNRLCAPRPSRQRPDLLSGPAARALALLADWEEATAEELAAATGVVPANARKALAIAGGRGLATRIEGTTSWKLTNAGHQWLVEHPQEVAA